MRSDCEMTGNETILTYREKGNLDKTYNSQNLTPKR